MRSCELRQLRYRSHFAIMAVLSKVKRQKLHSRLMRDERDFGIEAPKGQADRKTQPDR